jgi:hypothetical protein
MEFFIVIIGDVSFAHLDIVVWWLPRTCATSWKASKLHVGNDTVFSFGRLEVVIGRNPKKTGDLSARPEASEPCAGD